MITQPSRDKKSVISRVPKTRKSVANGNAQRNGKTPTGRRRNHPKFGTSKLEEKFAKEFLDKLGVKYVWQFEAKDIKRFYDFFCPDDNVLIEVDGDFYHGFGLVHEEKTPMQKHNEFVDKLKDKWAYEHGIPIIRIWEHDIIKHPDETLKFLSEKLASCSAINEKKKNKAKRH